MSLTEDQVTLPVIRILLHSCSSAFSSKTGETPQHHVFRITPDRTSKLNLHVCPLQLCTTLPSKGHHPETDPNALLSAVEGLHVSVCSTCPENAWRRPSGDSWQALGPCLHQ